MILMGVVLGLEMVDWGGYKYPIPQWCVFAFLPFYHHKTSVLCQKNTVYQLGKPYTTPYHKIYNNTKA